MRQVIREYEWKLNKEKNKVPMKRAKKKIKKLGMNRINNFYTNF